jgi:hypothetical protein
MRAPFDSSMSACAGKREDSREIGTHNERSRPGCGAFTMTDAEIIAREVSGYRARLDSLEARLLEVEHGNARLESAAMTTARSLGEVSRNWNVLYEAMRRAEPEPSVGGRPNGPSRSET